MDHVVVRAPSPPDRRVPPVGGGDVNRDWEGCRKGEVVDGSPRIEEEEMEEDGKKQEKSKKMLLRHW